MANVKISGLPTASTPLTGAELVPVVQSGVTSQTTVSDFGAAVSYTPSGTGAVATTVQTKLRETVSVKDFGAVGDGVTDDTAAIQAAINAIASYTQLFFPVGTYIVSSQLSIPTDYIVLCGKAKIKCASTSNYEFILYATGRTGITIRDLEFDLNQSARSGIQTVRFHGPYFASCTDCAFDNVTVKNTLGYGGISAVGISIGQGTRVKIENCTLIDCGTAAKTSDAIYTSGTQNVISNCIAYNCTDTGFVIEDSDFSVISGCTSIGCGSGAGIGTSLATNRYGNIINGLTVKNWNASSTGGIQIATLASTGNLYDTTISNVAMYADTGSGFGSGGAFWVRRVGTGNVIGLNINNAQIDGATYGIRVNDGANINISDCQVRNVTSSAFLFLAGGIHTVKDSVVNSAATGIDAQGTGTTVYAVGNLIQGTTSAAYQALNTSVITSINNKLYNLTSGSRTIKDASATIDFGGTLSNIVTNSSATYSVNYNDQTIIQTTSASVYTLPSASSAVGMVLNISTQFAGTVTSASSNVVPLAGGAAGTAILPATAGKWATLQSNGSYWYIIASN